MDGVLVVDKPKGVTSAYCVGQIKRTTKERYVGHAGTLDPLATGILVICVGYCTKVSDYLMSETKQYVAEFLLGIETDTHDITGEVEQENVVDTSAEDIEKVLVTLRGEIQQVPPRYSAIKIHGKRAYRLAREGKHVSMPVRTVNVEEFRLQSFDGKRGTVFIRCSKGTYVRSLLRDLGRGLGCGATMTELRRTAVGHLMLPGSIPWSLCENQDEIASRLLPAHEALRHLASVVVKEDIMAKVSHGAKMPWKALDPDDDYSGVGVLALYTNNNDLLALVSKSNKNQVNYRRVFTTGLTQPR